ncbi:hypothetical protein C8F04DRAFT_1281165 [Mycena alexandri]|uniref:F-box domain-containing protein n=1 Tax=Mycena alexandri TaxID=1745969 RepID=A0AAD6WK88_9AGAR|nr:hypothetical protein C8F04DRAFT_1281165 [Mycena alexandri]
MDTVKAKMLAQLAAARAAASQANQLLHRAVVQEESEVIHYPVLTLPVELTSEIFCWTLVAPWPEVEGTPLEGPLRLGQICRLWREIALSTPALWTSLHLPLRRRIPESYLSRIQTVLSRTASLPLTISLTAQYRVQGDSEALRLRAMEEILNVLAPHSRTWAEISFKTPPDPLNALHSIHHQLPQLTSLELLLEFTPADGTVGTMFNHAPMLRNVHLSRFGSQRLALPWTQLTSLHIDSSRLHQLAETISWTPNLVELIVGDITEGGPLPHIPALPHLKSLIFTITSPYLQPIILSLLDAQVRKLKIGVYDLSPLLPTMAHPTAVEELSIDLDTLGVNSTSIESLTSMSSVRTLKIAAHDLTRFTGFSFQPIVSRLTQDPLFLPALESLTFILLQRSSVEDDYPADIDNLSDMLCVRWNNGTGLQRFKFLSRRALPDLDHRQVDLIAQGMQIRLETVPGLEVDFCRAEF